MGAGKSSLPALQPIQTVVDMPRYMGKWFVIGVKPTYFEVGAHNAVEVYTWNQRDDCIDIDFTYNPDSFKAPAKKIPQKGFVHDKRTNAEWRVSPMWPLKLPYLIIELDSTEGTAPYEYTVIGYPSRAYVWIMARQPTMDEKLYDDICGRLKTQHHYDLDGLVKVPHSQQK